MDPEVLSAVLRTWAIATKGFVPDSVQWDTTRRLATPIWDSLWSLKAA